MRLLALDRGNTNLKAALIEDGRISDIMEISPESLQRIGIEAKKFAVQELIFSSVVPEWSKEAKEMFNSIGLKYIEVGPHMVLPFRLLVSNPGSLGADRISLAAGAKKLGYEAAVIVDVGTAVTVDLLTREGFEGGSIFPGIVLIERSLEEGTAQLKSIGPIGDIKYPPGKDTREAVSSGAFWGLVGAVNSLIQKTMEESKEVLPVILTGGFAEKIEPFMDPECEYRKDLIFLGLYNLFLLNS